MERFSTWKCVAIWNTQHGMHLLHVQGRPGLMMYESYRAIELLFSKVYVFSQKKRAKYFGEKKNYRGHREDIGERSRATFSYLKRQVASTLETKRAWCGTLWKMSNENTNYLHIFFKKAIFETFLESFQSQTHIFHLIKFIAQKIYTYFFFASNKLWSFVQQSTATACAGADVIVL